MQACHAESCAAVYLGRLAIVADIAVDEVLGAPVVNVYGVLVVPCDYHQALAIAREAHGHNIPVKSGRGQEAHGA